MRLELGLGLGFGFRFELGFDLELGLDPNDLFMRAAAFGMVQPFTIPSCKTQGQGEG